MGIHATLEKPYWRLCRVREGVLDKVVAGGAPQVAPEGRGLQGGDMAVQQDKEGTFG